MQEGNLVFADEQFVTFQNAGKSFLKSYRWLAAYNKARDRKVYNVVPKFHYLYHLLQQSKYLNPRFCWCYGDEDLVGRASSLAHSCTRGTPPTQVLSKIVQHYRVAKHIEWSRLCLWRQKVFVITRCMCTYVCNI